MKIKGYPLEQNEAATQFVFFSVGNRGRIMKAIVISPYDRNRWNLAFGDVGPDLEIDDRVTTNNNDVAKVLGTMLLNFHTKNINFDPEIKQYGKSTECYSGKPFF